MAGGNFFDTALPTTAGAAPDTTATQVEIPSIREHDAAPPPSSEADYGDNVVQMSGRGRGGRTWKDDWHMTPAGTPQANLFNAAHTLRHHPKLIGCVRLDDMAGASFLHIPIPGPDTENETGLPRLLRDSDIIAIQECMQVTGLRRITKETVRDAVLNDAEAYRYHPIRDYLSGLTWDGETRIAGWLSRYLGVEGGPYADNIGRLFLIGMVARVMRPGCKMDYMPVFEGDQGAGKSQACKILGGDWFSDNLPDLGRSDPVRLSMHLRGKWLIEIAEMSSFSTVEVSTLKEFLTQAEERYTPKYARLEVAEPRQCVFIGSTNETAGYLRDATGARRFWPLKIGRIDLDALDCDRDQLFAEAIMAFQEGAEWFPDREFEREYIKPQQEARYESDAWEDATKDWVQRESVIRCTVGEALRGAISIDMARIGKVEQRRMGSILRRMGWTSKPSHGRLWYHQPDEPEKAE